MASRGSFLPPNDTGFAPPSIPPIAPAPTSVASAPGPAARRRVDMRWGRVTMAQLEDDEFLQKQLRRLEIEASARHSGRGEALGSDKESGADPDHLIRVRVANARAKAARGVNSEQENDDSQSDATESLTTPRSAADLEEDELKERELVNALCIIADLDTSTRGELIQQRLTAALRQQCVFPNPVYKLIALRRKIMQHVQVAVSAQHKQRASATAQWTLMVDAVRESLFPSPSHSGNVTTSRVGTLPHRLANSDAAFTARGAQTLIGEGAVAIQELSWMLASLPDTKVSADFHKKEFLHEILQLLSQMPPLALAPHSALDLHNSADSGMGAARVRPEDSTKRALELSGLVDSIHEFLFDVAPKPMIQRSCPGSPKAQVIASASGAFDIDDRTNAVNALAYLAAATGSVRDFLVLVKVLLGAPDISHEVLPSSCSCTPASLFLGASQDVAAPMSEQNLVLTARDHVEIGADLRGKLRSQRLSPSELTGRNMRQEALMHSDELEMGFDGEKPSSSISWKPGPKTTAYKSSNPAAINPVLSGTKPTSIDDTTGPRGRIGSTSKSRQRDEYSDVTLPTGSLSMVTDINAARRELSARTTMMASSRAETPLVSARGPKLKPLQVSSLISQLEGAEPILLRQTAKARQVTRSLDGTTWNIRDRDCVDTDDSNDEREVWSCGQNSYGELGHGDTTSRKSFERIESLQGKDVVLLGAGNEHTIALSEDGKVYTCGYNDNGQCGQGGTARVAHMTEVPKMSEFSVAQVHAFNGCEHTIMVLSNGLAASCGYNYRGQLGHGNTTSETVPKIIRSLESRIVRLVSCSYYHTVMTCEDIGGGTEYVMTFGRNDYGQLGHNDTIDRKVPQHVAALSTYHIVSVACGQYHTTVVTSNGKVFGFGKNDYGQLGVDSVGNQLLPMQVRGLLDKQVALEVRSGYYHTVILCGGAHLFGFGRNDYGQLGLGKSTSHAAANSQLLQQRFSQPCLLEDLEGKEIARFACGCYHTVAVSESGMMYVFGRNNHGQLGTGDTNERLYPFPIDDFLGKRVALVAAGFYHTVVLTGGKESEKEDQDKSGNVNRTPTEDEEANPPFVGRSEVSFADILESPVMTEFVQNQRAQSLNRDGLRLQFDFSSRSPIPNAAETHGEDIRDEDVADSCDQMTALSPESNAGNDNDNPVQISVSQDSKTPSSSSDPVKLVAFVFAQLDRLSQNLLPKQSIQIAHSRSGAQAAALNSGGTVDDLGIIFPGGFDSYVVHVRSATLEHLCALVHHLTQRKIDTITQLHRAMLSVAAARGQDQASRASKSTEIPSDNHGLQLYMLLVCLRILRANMMQLRRSGIAQTVLAYIEVAGKSPTASKTTVGCGKELELLKGALQQVRDVLFCVVDARHRRNSVFYDSGNGEMSARALSEAVDALMESFDVLIPCHCLQAQFYEHILRDGAMNDSITNCWCSKLWRHGLTSGAALLPKSKTPFIIPLMKHLNDDVNVVMQMPFALGASLSCSPPASALRSGDSDPLRIISGMYRVLLLRLSDDFSHQVSQEVQPNVDVRQISLTATSALRMFQKHIACWALDCPSWQRNIREVDQEPTLAHSMQGLVANVIDSTFRIDETVRDAVPLPWRAMVEFALAVTSTCCQALTLISAQPPRHTEHHTYRPCRSTSTSSETSDSVDVHANTTPSALLERSPVGQLLPSLVTALFEFTNKPLFAAALLPNVKGLLKMLDAFNRQFTLLGEMDKDFIDSVASQFSSGSARGLNACRTSTDRESVGGQSRNGVARQKQLANNGTGQAANLSDALTLPWNYRLEKELAVLVSEMLVTVAIGEPLVQWTRPAPSSEQPQSCLFFNTLLHGGLNPSFLAKSVRPSDSCLALSPRRVVPHSPFPTASQDLPPSLSGEFLPFSLTLPAISANELDSSISLSFGAQGQHNNAALDIRRYRRLLSRAGTRKFLLSLVSGDSTNSDEWGAAGNKMCEWIREKYAKTDPSYQMLLQMASKARKPLASEDQRDEQIRVNDARIESSVFAALTHHNALAYQAFHFALVQNPGGYQSPPPSTFMKLWKFVADLRRHIAARKTAIRSQQQVNPAPEAKNSMVKDDHDQILDLQRACLERCELLLLVDVLDEEMHANAERDSGFVGPHNPACIASACVEYNVNRFLNGRPATMKTHLQARYTEDRLPFLVAFPWSKWRLVRVLVHSISRWRACCIRTANAATLRKGSSSFETAMIDVSRRVVQFVTSSDSVASPVSIREYLVDPCRRRSCSARGFEMLWELLATVSFDSIKADLIHQVTQALVFRARDSSLLSAGHHAHLRNAGVFYTDLYNNAHSDFLMQLTELIADKASVTIDAPDYSELGGFWVLGELLASWGMRFDADQFEFVSDIGILPLIHQLLGMVSGAELLDSEKTRQTPGSSRMSSFVYVCDRSLGSSDTPQTSDAAAMKCSRLLHRTLWTVFQSVCANFASPSSISSRYLLVSQLESPVESSAVVSPLLTEPLQIVYSEALRVTRMTVPCWQLDSVNFESSNAVALPGGIRRSYDLLAKTTRFSRLHQRATFEYQSMLAPPSGILPMSPLLKPNEFSITTWMFIRGGSATSRSLHNPDDYVLTLQPLPERQLVFVRGDGSELGPYLMIVPDNATSWQLEVGFVLHFENGEIDLSRTKAHPSNILCECLLSKDSVPTDRWVHVAVVVEAAKVRLYLNGVLDSQRTISAQYAAAWATRDVGLPFHFGRFAFRSMTQSRATDSDGDGIDAVNDTTSSSCALGLLTLSLSSSKNASFRSTDGPALHTFDCFDGWLNQFRFHNRALSPIHVQIVYDELKTSPIGNAATSRSTNIPNASRVSPATTLQHARLLDLHALVIQLASSPEGIVHFRDQFARWMHLLWRSFLCSESFKLQQSSLRVLQSLLLYQEPAAVTRALLSTTDATGSVASAAECHLLGFRDLNGGFVQQLLRMIGFGLMSIRSKRSANESSYALPCSLIIPSGVHGSASTPTPVAGTMVAGCKLPSDIAELEESSKQRNLFVINEVTELLHRLRVGTSGPSTSEWKKVIDSVITSILNGESTTGISACDDRSEAVSHYPDPEQGFLFGETFVHSSTVDDAEVMGCLYLLGGLTETSLRPGAAAQLRLTCDSVRVIAIDGPRYPPNEIDPRMAGGSSSTDTSAPEITCVVVGDDPPSISKQLLPASSIAERINVRCDELLPALSVGILASKASTENSTSASIDLERSVLSQARRVCPGVCDQLVMSRRWPTKNLEALKLRPGLGKSTVGMVEQSLQLMQMGNMLLKCLSQSAQREDFALEILEDTALTSTIFKASVENDGGTAFNTLTNVEREAFRLRQRVFAVLIDLGEEGSQELASYFESTTAMTNSEADEPSVDISQTSTPLTGRESTPTEDGENGMRLGAKYEQGEDILNGDEEDDEEENTDNDEGLAEDSEDELEGADDEGEDPDEDSETEESRAEFVDELVLMGFPEEWCVLALKQTENDIISASAWIVDNLDYLSKLQVSLDKKREDDRNTPRFNEDDDDEDQDADEGISAIEEKPSGSPFFRRAPPLRPSGDGIVDVPTSVGASSLEESADLGNRQRDNAGITTRTLPVDSMDLPATSSNTKSGINGLDEFTPPALNDKEMGRKIFGEMYFPFEEGGYLSNASSQFQLMWTSDEVELKVPTSPESNAIGSKIKQGGAIEPGFSDATFEAYIAQLDVIGMVERLRNLERQLMVAYCRFLAVSILQHIESAYRKRAVAETNTYQPFQHVLRLLPFVIKRGDQFGSNNPTASLDSTIISEHVMRQAVMFMLAHDSDEAMPHAIEYVLEQSEIAAWSKHLEASLWTQRELRRPDEQVIAEPAVEVAIWLVDCMLAGEESGKISFLTRGSNVQLVQTMLRRFRCTLGSTNLPLKCFVLSTISRILRALSRSIGEYNDPKRSRGDSNVLRTLIESAKLTAREVMVAAKQRLAREAVQERQLYSLYLQSYVELLLALNTAYSCENEGLSTPDGAVVPFCTFGASVGPIDTLLIANGERDDGFAQQQQSLTDLTFDHKRNRTGLLAFSYDWQSVAYSGNDAWKAACAEKRMSTGQHAWAVRIDKSSSSYIFVGVATRQFNADSFLGADDQSWGFIGDKALYYQRSRMRAFGEAFGEGDTIGVHLDCERGTLGFTKNGAALGIAFDNVVGELYPAVSLYSRHQRVTLVGGIAFQDMDTSLTDQVDASPPNQTLREQPNLPLCAPGVDSSSGSIDACLLACELMESMLERKPIRLALMQAAHQLTTYWLAGSTNYATTRAGWSLWVDVTPEKCKRFGFRAGERVRTSRGNGTVAGVAHGRVWVHVDGESGAWFIHPTKLRTLSVVDVSTDESLSESQKTIIDDLTSAPPNVKRPSEPASDQIGDAPTSLSFDAFASLGQHSRWGGVARDRELLRLVNDHCESTRTSPWNVSPDGLLRLVRDKQKQQPGVLDTNAGSFVLDDGSSDSDTASLILISRFALLRYFNLALSHSLPFFDLTWRYYAVDDGESGGVSHPCKLLSACRGSVFLCLKNDFFASLMQRTANSARKAEDEYDYPDDLPQLQVNRLKAAAAKCHPGTTKSLFLSLFGQTFEVMHFLPLRTLRMVYSHPMDDGQLRCFRVKFEGEGADDYGGPYREFFSQFFAELQTLNESPESHDSSANGTNADTTQQNEAPTGCLLPFLMPSPNWRSGVGSSREKFVLNASLVALLPLNTTTNSRRSLLSESPEEKRQLYREMFVFLGQMLGTCLRTGVCVRLDLATSVWKQLVAEDDATHKIAPGLDDENTESALSSLKEIDFVAFSLWRNLKALQDEYECRKASGPVAHLEEQLAAMDLDFTTTLSDGRTVKLRQVDSSTPVMLSSLSEYLRLMLDARVHEASEAVALIKRGINSILPVSALGLLTWQELETRVCGVDEIDVELLRANTEYDEDVSPTDEFVQRFWRVLEGMDTSDRRAFLRFVWARSRLPLGAAQFHQKFKIQLLSLGGTGGDAGTSSTSAASSSSASTAMDAQLPKSHTCFFALQLPRYSSDEICRKQLLYAVHNCVEMDGDFRLADTEMTGWADVSAADQLRL